MIRSIRNIDFAAPATPSLRLGRGFTEQAEFLLFRTGNSQAIACRRCRGWIGLANRAQGGDNDRPE